MKFLIVLFLLTPTLSYAKVYTWINEQGVRVYGDEPPAHANKVELPDLQEMKMPKVVQKKEKEEEAAAEGFKGYEAFEIISPKEDHMITAEAAGNATIQLHIHPELQPKHEISLLLNGRIVETKAALYFELNNLNRGSHLLQAQIKHNGKLIISSPKRRIHVQRPSILNRSRSN